MSKAKDNKENIVEEQVDTTQAETAEATETVEMTVEEKLKEELGQEKDKFLRLFADFENYKKRTSKERVELFQTASKDVMVSLLPILDDFDRAYSEISKTKEKDLLKGVELISQKLKTTLTQKGLSEMEVKAGDAFDADFHQAVTQIPAPTADLKGKIVDVIEKGYKLGETVIRFPKVVTGQ